FQWHPSHGRGLPAVWRDAVPWAVFRDAERRVGGAEGNGGGQESAVVAALPSAEWLLHHRRAREAVWRGQFPRRAEEAGGDDGEPRPRGVGAGERRRGE